MLREVAHENATERAKEKAKAGMWKDGHHPTACSHARIAARIDDILKREQS